MIDDIEYKSILCNSDEEINECAEFLIKRGYAITNYDKENKKFRERVPSILEWKGLTRFGTNEWIRFHPQSFDIDKNTIKFNILLRKEKLNKLNYGKL